MEIYRQHFKHGGFDGTPGKPFQNHQFRALSTAPFGKVHRNQATEYSTLQLGMQLAGDDLALPCISMGGPQLLVSSFAWLGYATPRQMYDDFQAQEGSHVTGFFDFCMHKSAPQADDLLAYLRTSNWTDFARYYNGSGQVAAYGQRLSDTATAAAQLNV